MNEEERKVIAFLLGVVFKLAAGIGVTENEVQQVSNLCDEYGTADLDEREFRY